MGPLAAAVLSIVLAVQEVPGHLTRSLIGQLHGDRIEQREAAARSLFALGPSVLPHLEEVAQSREVEVAGRARWVIAAVEEILHRETFRKLENAFNQAGSLTLRYKSEYQRTDESDKVRNGSGVLILKDEGKFLLSCTPPPSKWAETLTCVSDGATVGISAENPITRKSSPLFKESLGRLFVRRGFREAERLVYFYLLGEINEPAFATSSSMTNLRRGPDDGDARTLSYEVTQFGCDVSRITLWYDPKTSLILKRTTENTKFGAWSSLLIETYDVQLNADVPEDRFALTRK